MHTVIVMVYLTSQMLHSGICQKFHVIVMHLIVDLDFRWIGLSPLVSVKEHIQIIKWRLQKDGSCKMSKEIDMLILCTGLVMYSIVQNMFDWSATKYVE